MGIVDVLICMLWALFAAGTGWYCLRIAGQMTYVTLADGRRQERCLPLLLRLLMPLAAYFAPFFAKASLAGTRDRVRRRITAAGFEGLLSAEEFLGLRVAAPLCIGTLWVLAVRGAIPSDSWWMLLRLRAPLTILGLLWSAAYPAFWLATELRLRHNSMRRSLPFVLDMLTLAVEAGMDFMGALQQNTLAPKLDALGEELLRVVREIQLGKTRREALRDMSVRVDLSELRSVVNALVQADELGVSIGAILRIQADQMRQRRFERAERLANEAPVKMLFPLMFFIFPAVFLVLLGPILVRLINQGF